MLLGGSGTTDQLAVKLSGVGQSEVREDELVKRRVAALEKLQGHVLTTGDGADVHRKLRGGDDRGRHCRPFRLGGHRDAGVLLRDRHDHAGVRQRVARQDVRERTAGAGDLDVQVGQVGRRNEATTGGGVGRVRVDAELGLVAHHALRGLAVLVTEREILEERTAVRGVRAVGRLLRDDAGVGDERRGSLAGLGDLLVTLNRSLAGLHLLNGRVELGLKGSHVGTLFGELNRVRCRLHTQLGVLKGLAGLRDLGLHELYYLVRSNLTM